MAMKTNVPVLLAAILAAITTSTTWIAAAENMPPDPESLGWDIRIADEKEPGEPLVLSGTIYRSDGETPAAGIILYAYHTDKDGIYPGRGGDGDRIGRHGSIHAWLRTNERGEYRITTIRPGSYPGSRIPQHIHASVITREGKEIGIPDFHFADDPYITEAARERAARTGAGNIVVLERDEDGVWRGTRDIVLVD